MVRGFPGTETRLIDLFSSITNHVSADFLCVAFTLLQRICGQPTDTLVHLLAAHFASNPQIAPPDPRKYFCPFAACACIAMLYTLNITPANLRTELRSNDLDGPWARVIRSMVLEGPLFGRDRAWCRNLGRVLQRAVQDWIDLCVRERVLVRVQIPGPNSVEEAWRWNEVDMAAWEQDQNRFTVWVQCHAYGMIDLAVTPTTYWIVTETQRLVSPDLDLNLFNSSFSFLFSGSFSFTFFLGTCTI